MRLLCALKQTSWRMTNQSCIVVVDQQSGALTKSQNRVAVQMMELHDSLLASLALVLAVGVWVEIVRIDVERSQLKCIESRR